MKRVRRFGTKPELLVRALLTSAGAHYRLNAVGLPGRPDISNKSRRKAVFVHGCFWHKHEHCRRGKIPKGNSEFWSKKLARNVERDISKTEALRGLGFDVMVVWECELKDRDGLLERLRGFWFE
jgi:DNA mismatch endonuclease (patch repair protein)